MSVHTAPATSHQPPVTAHGNTDCGNRSDTPTLNVVPCSTSNMKNTTTFNKISMENALFYLEVISIILIILMAVVAIVYPLMK